MEKTQDDILKKSLNVTLIICQITTKLDWYGGTLMSSISGFWSAGGLVMTKVLATS